MNKVRADKRRCSGCPRTVPVNNSNGKIRHHLWQGVVCPGVGLPPARPTLSRNPSEVPQ